VLARTAAEVHTLICAFVYVFDLHCDMILFGGSSRYSVRGQASAPQQGHQRYWDCIVVRARAREEA